MLVGMGRLSVEEFSPALDGRADITAAREEGLTPEALYLLYLGGSGPPPRRGPIRRTPAARYPTNGKTCGAN